MVQKAILIMSFVFGGGNLSGCSLLGGGNDDPAVKSRNLRYKAPTSPYEQMDISSADKVWQSRKTGNTIAFNSMCQKYGDVSLKDLQSNILAGIDDIRVVTSQSISFNQREAQRIDVEGTTDGIAIRIDLMTFKKNGCNFDIAYISRKITFDSEHQHFENFLKEFEAP